MLREADQTCVPIEGLAALEEWIRRTPALSNEALATAIPQETDPSRKKMLEQALDWSRQVNAAIDALPE
ncbi:hypothetical protein QIG69_27240, partial [Klebsiella pneumoniae]|nr:hypothetical protein [Klebsiella pneumoniae]